MLLLVSKIPPASQAGLAFPAGAIYAAREKTLRVFFARYGGGAAGAPAQKDSAISGAAAQRIKSGINRFLLIKDKNGERRTENGERRTENGERRTAFQFVPFGWFCQSREYLPF
jgi:hypothetical protein